LKLDQRTGNDAGLRAGEAWAELAKAIGSEGFRLTTGGTEVEYKRTASLGAIYAKDR